MSKVRRTALPAALVALGFLSGALLIRQGATARDAATKPDSGNAFGVIEIDDPLGGAELVSRAEAEAVLSNRSQSWPALPSEATVTQAWVRDDGYVAFELDSGLTIIFSPESRSEADFIADAKEMAESEGANWPFELVSIRGTEAQVTDINKRTTPTEGVQVGPGPAAMSWIEGGYLVSLTGGPPATASGLSLSELVTFAETMG
jgi:hypothetical protein